jgi:hypothetical protein
MSLLDQASLIVTPNGYKASKLYSVKPTNGDGDMVVSRGTSATRVDSAGLIEIARTNLILQSQTFDNASWSKAKEGINPITTIPLVTANQGISPDGTMTADRVEFNCGGNLSADRSRLTQGSLVTTIGTRYYLSIYVKAFSPNEVGKELRIASDGLTNSTITITADWQRIVLNGLASSISSNFIVETRGNVTANTTADVLLWGAQFEQGSTATSYIPTEASIRTKFAGITQDGSVAQNIPRLDYTNASCPSILIESARTNVVLHSGDLSQSVWSKSNYALTSATSIQGLTTTRITKNAIDNGYYLGLSSRNVINSVGTFALGIKTLTWLIKKGNTDKVAFVINSVLVGALTNVKCEFNFTTQTFTNVSLGLNASFENPTTDVYKITLTINDIGVLTNKAIWIAPIDNSNNTVDGGYLDFAFAQWEAGSNATSYIPTTTIPITRVADVINKTGITNLIGQTEGTIFIEANLTANADERRLLTISNGTELQRIIFWTLGTTLYMSFNSTGVSLGNFPIGTTKIALGYTIVGGSTTYNIKVNNNTLITGSIAFAPNPLTNINLGSSSGGFGLLNDRISNIILWKTALSPTQLGNLTT